MIEKKMSTYYRINIKMNHVKEIDIENHTNFLMTCQYKKSKQTYIKMFSFATLATSIV